MEFKKLLPQDLNDLIQLIELYKKVFEEHTENQVSEKYLSTLLKNQSIIFLVAKHGDTVVGGLTAHVLPSVHFESSEVYLYDLAVDNAFQRQGIGTALVSELKKYCCENNYKELFVQADFEDKHALDFYRKIGGVEENVRHFNFSV